MATWALALKRSEPISRASSLGVHTSTRLSLASHGSLEHCGLIPDIYHTIILTSIIEEFYFLESILSKQWVKKALLVKVPS